MGKSEQIDWMLQEFSNAGILLDRDKAEALYLYYERLIEMNQVMNLTAITEYEDVVRKHFADSLAISKFLDFHNIHRVIDIGTGAGFPGMVLKIAFPDISFVLLDSLAKRLHFLEELSSELGLKDISFVHARTEDAARMSEYREGFDLAVSRAVAQLNVLSEYCLPYVRVGGIFAAYKAGDVQEEIANAKKAVKILGGREKKVESFSFYDMQRSFVMIEKCARTPGKYPRRAGLPSKNPL